ncbi:FecR/PupR family sigma factor regulator [Diaphorobacter sp. HDW4A]|uniref:FecR/PupR family sigma factor regulator n=1 Tax=Betaproteobacteria TaxID=28216 RepID=UPI00140A0EE6|nr:MULTISPECIES: FecR/PupR family sigma factor regulator [Betaproteobacteria]MCK6392701.1 FecR/PupR family sigma factor regulator [Zoogloea sp.]MCK6408921.1 FecR/PupR family sigma factor regulator [Thauera sp.]QIL78927.1 FecR/PupR family sigma factor regulator [Diaphorobacter sp. HDW4A]
MGEEVNPKQDPVWDFAWSWVMRQHEHQGLDAAAEVELAHWLAADPAHRQAYDKAGRLWLMAGLVPPANDIDIPGCTKPDGER